MPHIIKVIYVPMTLVMQWHENSFFLTFVPKLFLRQIVIFRDIVHLGICYVFWNIRQSV